MLIRHHYPALQPPPWIVNDPVAAAGAAGVEAFYATLWSHPSILLVAGGFPQFAEAGADAPAGQEPEIHVVTLTGAKDAWVKPALRPGDRIFFDGLSKAPFLGEGARAPRFHLISSMKERLVTPLGDFLIPQGLPLGVWTSIPDGWAGLGDRDGMPFFLFSGECFASPVCTPYVDFILRRDKGRGAWNWRGFLAAGLARWLGADEDAVVPERGRDRDLGDAFSAFGFHRWVVMQTAGKLGAPSELAPADAVVMEAAEAFRKSQHDRAEKLLQAGFDRLKSRLDDLTGVTRRYFAEAHHGGMLHEDIGFFEHDWPQMVCDTLRSYLAFPGVVVSLDMPANVYRHYRNRFPSFFGELRHWIEEGRVELLNGMYGQPLSDCHTLENFLAQFHEGHREMCELFGRPPEIFAMEEYSLGPAMPQILSAAGIREAVHMVRLGGTSKTAAPAVRLWKGIGLGTVRAVEGPDTGAPGLSTGYFLQLPDVLAQAKRLGRETLPLFNIPDFGWNVLFRDEIFTAMRFAPVLFEMVTFRELFDLMPRSEEQVKGRWEDTYHTTFNSYTIRGNMRRHFENLRQFEILLVAADMCTRFSGRRGRSLDGGWQDYLLGSSHDYTLVGGGFNGWYGAATKATYMGPVQSTYQRTLESVISTGFDTWREDLAGALTLDAEGPYLTNLHGFAVPLPGPSEEGAEGQACLDPFASLPVKQPRLRPRETSCRIFADEAVLQSGSARCVISRETGALSSVEWNGGLLWQDNRLGLLLGDRPLRVAEGLFREVPDSEGCFPSLRHFGRLTDDRGHAAGWLETYYQMRGDDLLVEMVFCPALLPPRGDFDHLKEWQGTYRYALPKNLQSPRVWVCQANAMLRVSPSHRDPGALANALPHAIAHVTSPEVLGWESRTGCPVWCYNAGFPGYLVHDDRIEQFLLMPGEQHLRLRFGIGFGNGPYSPVQRSRMLLHPPVRTRRPLPPLPIRWRNPRLGLLRADDAAGGTGYKLWFWNFSERKELFEIEIQASHRLVKTDLAPVDPSSGNRSGAWSVEPYSLFTVELQAELTGVNFPGGSASSSAELAVT